VRTPWPLAGEDRLPGGLAEALQREVAAALRLLEGAATERPGPALTPVRFRFGFGADQEILVTVAAGGSGAVEPALPPLSTDGADDGR
jgi:hypothetical protein